MSDPLSRIRQVALSLPEAFEQEAWGEPTFRVARRMFAMFANDHHRDGRVAVWLPAPIGTQQYLVDDDPGTYFVPTLRRGEGLDRSGGGALQRRGPALALRAGVLHGGAAQAAGAGQRLTRGAACSDL